MTGTSTELMEQMMQERELSTVYGAVSTSQEPRPIGVPEPNATNIYARLSLALADCGRPRNE